MKNKVIEALAMELGLPIGGSFTCAGVAGEYTLTKDGIVKDNHLISQQELLCILYGSKISKKLVS